MGKYVFGVDIGGTTVKLGLFDADSNLLDKWEIPTVTANHGEGIIPDCANSIKAKMEEKGIAPEDVIGVGVGAPGAVNEDGYLVGGAVNLGWDEFDLKGQFEKLLGGIPVKEGDEVAIEIAEKFGYYLGKGLASVANVANPSMFVIGGGVSKAGEILIPYIVPHFQKFAFPPCRGAKFALAKLGNDAGIYGAAGMILEETDVK